MPTRTAYLSFLLTMLASPAFAVDCDLTKIVEINIAKFAFIPQKIEICAGQTVRWTNNETRRVAHTVTADPTLAADLENVLLPDTAATFDSGTLLPGETFSVTLTVPGEYKYICLLHELMGHKGSITVVPAPVVEKPIEKPVEEIPAVEAGAGHE